MSLFVFFPIVLMDLFSQERCLIFPIILIPSALYLKHNLLNVWNLILDSKLKYCMVIYLPILPWPKMPKYGFGLTNECSSPSSVFCLLSCGPKFCNSSLDTIPPSSLWSTRGLFPSVFLIPASSSIVLGPCAISDQPISIFLIVCVLLRQRLRIYLFVIFISPFSSKWPKIFLSTLF